MTKLTEDQIAHLVTRVEEIEMTEAARRADVLDAAAMDFVPAIRKSFRLDPTTRKLVRNHGVPETVTIASILDAARTTHPHRFREGSSSVHAEQNSAVGKFAGFVKNATGGEDFFHLSPEEKIALANERVRPKGWN